MKISKLTQKTKVVIKLIWAISYAYKNYSFHSYGNKNDRPIKVMVKKLMKRRNNSI